MSDLSVIDPELVSVKTLGRLLDVPEKTVRTWVYRREIPYHKLGKLVRFRIDEIRRWYSASRVEPLTAPTLKDKIL